MKIKSYKTIGTLLLLVALLIPSIFSLLQPGFFESDDGEWMIIRFSSFYQSLSDGQFPVRFLGRLNYGFGYPVSNFLYPGFMYLAAPLKLMGLSFVSSIKLVLIISMVGGGFFTFKWLSKIFDEKSAFIGAVFYTYTPYHLYDLYKRGSVGEILSICLLPFILWQLERQSVFFTAIGIFFLVLAHNTLAVLFLLFIVFYMGLNVYVSKKKKDLSLNYLITLLLGIGMASFFWLPAILELKYTVFSNTQVSEWQNYFANINLIGLSTFAVFLIIIILIFSKKISIKKHRLTFLLLLIGMISVLLSNSISFRVWNIFPSSFVQFPFRFLSLVLPSIAFLAASIVSVFSGRRKTVLSVVLVIAVFFSSLDFSFPKVTFDKGDSFYSTNEATTNVKDEYMPHWVKEKPIARFSEKVELSDGVQTRNQTYNSKKIYFEVSSEKEQVARVNTIYYPGWIAKVNGREIEIDYGNRRGVIDLKLPSGANRVELKFTETPLRLFSDLISLLSFLILLLWARKDLRLRK